MLENRKKDQALLLRIPLSLKQAIEKRAGVGNVSAFIREAAEEKLTTHCPRCHGTGRLLGKSQN